MQRHIREAKPFQAQTPGDYRSDVETKYQKTHQVYELKNVHLYLKHKD